jgi:HK97 family phage portal protein
VGLAERVLTRAPTEQLEQRALQVTPWGPWTSSYGTSAGVNVTEDLSLNLLTVYGCVTLISDTIATLPRNVYRDLGEDVSEQVSILPRWFEQPNPDTDIIEFLTQSLTSLLLDGNAYWAYETDRNFMPNVIRVLNPVNMQVIDIGQGPVYIYKGAPYAGRLLHIKGLTRPGTLKGLSPIESARQSIGIGLAEQEFAGKFYENGAVLSAVIEVPGPMTQDQARDLRENISRAHGGVGKAHLPGVLSGGAKWNQISVTPEQMSFLESRQYQAAEICAQMFLLDPSMLGIASSGTRGQNLTYANLEQRGIHLVQFTLMRWIIRLERAFSFLLAKPQYMKFNVDAIQRADLKTRYEAYAIGTAGAAFLKINEPRALEELPPVPGGDAIPDPTPVANPLAVPASSNGKTPVGVP